MFFRHTRDDVLGVAEADHALHLGDFSNLFGEAFDLLQYLCSVDVVSNEADHPDLIAAKELAYLVVVVLFWVFLGKEAVD